MTTSSPDTPHNEALDAFSATFLRLYSLGVLARDAQYEPATIAVPEEDTTERSKGMTSDPTFNTATNPGRLALRDAWEEARRALEQAERLMPRIEARLRQALAEPSNNGSVRDDLGPQE